MAAISCAVLAWCALVVFYAVPASFLIRWRGGTGNRKLTDAEMHQVAGFAVLLASSNLIAVIAVIGMVVY